MQILAYNILNGFERKPERISAFLQFLEAHRYDILLLNEYREHHVGLADLLVEQGYLHSLVNRTSPSSNRCAIFSRIPFENRSSTQDFRVLHIRIEELELVSYHASRHGVAEVMKEAGKLVSMLEGQRNIILAGDFNSLSPNDREAFRYDQPAEEIPARYLNNGTISYSFIRLLEANRFADTNEGSEAKNRTVPTGIPHTEGYDFHARLDSAYARLHGNFRAISRVLRDACFDYLSEHYPLKISITRERAPIDERSGAASAAGT